MVVCLPHVDPDALLLLRIPVYGLCDSGRGFWCKVDSEARSVGFQVSRIFAAFYCYREDGRVMCVLPTHVEDLYGRPPKEAARSSITYLRSSK